MVFKTFKPNILTVASESLMIKTKHNCPICCFNSVTIGSWCWGNELINSRVKNKHCVVSVTHTTDWFDNGPPIILKIWSSFDNICTKLIRVTPFNHILGNITLIIIRFCTNCYFFCFIIIFFNMKNISSIARKYLKCCGVVPVVNVGLGCYRCNTLLIIIKMSRCTTVPTRPCVRYRDTGTRTVVSTRRYDEWYCTQLEMGPGAGWTWISWVTLTSEWNANQSMIKTSIHSILETNFYIDTRTKIFQLLSELYM